jgi:hypothetical protein
MSVDISGACAPKSDQLNADDLLGVTRDITIRGVRAGNAEQKIIIDFDGDNGKPWKPCKSMIRVLRVIYGDRAADWVGKRVRLYNDPAVRFGGVEVGGIRISHASGIDKPMTIALTVAKASRKPFKVEPLPVEKKPDFTADNLAKLIPVAVQRGWDCEETLKNARLKYEVGDDMEKELINYFADLAEREEE